ncbi:hypothetical protein SAMN04487943_101158 [Gracilibacillus orientalis]|uniref:DUF1772 domain-containing protein n=1 Tax=Gracilibacillus orientalis TaxID=334253 RepID=A0A1I4H1K0_9BACI|nr:hypothetical protein [Gracilibacillus orientalis]SFL36089.1 hypothetical protein SAMN04487943_101158 [Gracilibacillus orientalis]
MMKKIAFIAILAHLWIQWIMLGSILLDTFMVYPNIFYNIPESLEVSMEFMAVASPHTYFPPLGMASISTGILAVILSWKVKPARYWILLSMLMIVLEGATSMIFEWPRNEIMFMEGTAVHSIDFLIQTAREFLIVHGFRVAYNIIGSIFMFVGFIKYYKHLVLNKS